MVTNINPYNHGGCSATGFLFKYSLWDYDVKDQTIFRSPWIWRGLGRVLQIALSFG